MPFFGIEEQGLGGYLKSYAEPTIIMLPFNIISELSRTLALAVRLFGNMMSGTMIFAILLTITPFIFPIAMSALNAVDAREKRIAAELADADAKKAEAQKERRTL